MKRFFFLMLIYSLFSCQNPPTNAKTLPKNTQLIDSLNRIPLKQYDLNQLNIPAFEQRIPFTIFAPDSAIIEPNVVSVVENGISITKGIFRVNIDIYHHLKEQNETAEGVKQREWQQLQKDTTLAKVKLISDSLTGFIYQIENKKTGIDYSFFYAIVKDNILYEIQPAMNLLGNYRQEEIEWMYHAIEQKGRN